jgi:cellulose synthase/poly-beta-1,6-N-acetylglucosamine synthase-like glycosyltransferase
MKITYSIIAPIYNEIDNLPELYRRVKEVMDASGETWELILVDDGSTDGSTEGIRELARKDKTVRPIIFARNFGHQVAITAGWDYARGDAVSHYRRGSARPTGSHPRPRQKVEGRLRGGLRGTRSPSVRANRGSNCGQRPCFTA